jgi:hypothetical protein
MPCIDWSQVASHVNRTEIYPLTSRLGRCEGAVLDPLKTGRRLLLQDQRTRSQAQCAVAQCGVQAGTVRTM